MSWWSKIPHMPWPPFSELLKNLWQTNCCVPISSNCPLFLQRNGSHMATLGEESSHHFFAYTSRMLHFGWKVVVWKDSHNRLTFSFRVKLVNPSFVTSDNVGDPSRVASVESDLHFFAPFNTATLLIFRQVMGHP